jgi:hypothetical protein
MGLERSPLSLVTTTEGYLEGKSSGFHLESEITAVGDQPLWLRDISLSTEVDINFADKKQSLGRYSSLADLSHGVFFNARNLQKLYCAMELAVIIVLLSYLDSYARFIF